MKKTQLLVNAETVQVGNWNEHVRFREQTKRFTTLLA